MASTAPSIRVVKSFLYRGGTKEWSNRYHFDNSKPADNTKWTTFSDAIVTAEKAILVSSGLSLTITQTQGFDAGSEVPVFSKSYTTAGTFAVSTGQISPGDVASLVRYSTAAKTSKNHPIYLFNYYHGCIGLSVTDGDDLLTAYRTALTTYAGLWIAGFSDGSVTHHRCGPQGDLATGSFVSPYSHHRDFLN